MPEFVSVPVPVDRIQEVYELLSREPFRPLSERQAAGDGHPEVWTEPLMRRMFIESSSAMRRILLTIAEASPGWVTTKDIAVAFGLSARQVVASLGPFEKRVRSRYAMSSWPFEAVRRCGHIQILHVSGNGGPHHQTDRARSAA